MVPTPYYPIYALLSVKGRLKTKEIKTEKKLSVLKVVAVACKGL